MKRLLTLMLACAAILVMGIAATAVRADGGTDSPQDQAENGTTTTQPCTTQAGDSRARMSEDRHGTSGDDNESGTSGDDNMTGDEGDDDLCGDQGDDDLNGGSGDDVLKGASGNDTLVGGSGNDNEQGDAGDDDLQGDRGADHLNGGKGNDDISGGPGNDVINSRDGQRDVVNCGAGHDRVRADRKDRVAKNCESVSRG
jgi:Ca2+-binding RTX toxin-like protein